MASWVNNASTSSESSSKRRRWDLEDKKLLKRMREMLHPSDDSSEFEIGKQLLETGKI
jgi:hypothetical protein